MKQLFPITIVALAAVALFVSDVDADNSKGTCNSIIATALALALASPSGAQEGQTVPNFSLPDVNPNSVRGGQVVSPRDYNLQVAGFYFGSAG